MTEEANNLQENTENTAVEPIVDPVLADGAENTTEAPESSSDAEKPEQKEVTLENVELPEAHKELDHKDYIFMRKERQRNRIIEEKNAEIERLRRESEAKSNPIKQNFNDFYLGLPPLRDNFESDEDFIDARMNYNLARGAAEHAQRQQLELAKKTEQHFINRLKSAEEIGQEKYKDFDDVVEVLGSELTNKMLVDAVLDSEYSADIFYIMGKHKEVREKLNGMEPIKAVKELAKLESRFEQQIKSKKTQTSAKIIEQVKGSSGSASNATLDKMSSKDLDNMSLMEFARRDREERKQKGKMMVYSN